MPIKSIDPYRCDGCGACVRACPSDAIRMKHGKAYPAYPQDCTCCFVCEVVCPWNAIRVIPWAKIVHIPLESM